MKVLCEMPESGPERRDGMDEKEWVRSTDTTLRVKNMGAFFMPDTVFRTCAEW
jgi:hypothetical protein